MVAGGAVSHTLLTVRALVETGFPSVAVAVAGFALCVLLAFSFNRARAAAFKLVLLAILALALGGADSALAIRELQSAQMRVAGLADLRNAALQLEKVNRAIETFPK